MVSDLYFNDRAITSINQNWVCISDPREVADDLHYGRCCRDLRTGFFRRNVVVDGILDEERAEDKNGRDA